MRKPPFFLEKGMTTVQLRQLSDDVLERAGKRLLRRRFMVGIAGGPAAGKSTMAKAIVDELNRISSTEVAIYVPMDGFHKSAVVLKEEGTTPIKGKPETFDEVALWKFLRDLKNFRRPLSGPVYSREQHDVIADAYVIDKQFIAVVEGNYLFLEQGCWSKIRKLFDYKLFIDVPEKVAVDRLFARHLKGGKSNEEAARKIFEVDMKNFELVQPTAAFADRIICSAFNL
jgi:pantothenate kinase